MKDLEVYIKETFGIDCSISPIDKNIVSKLPIYLRGMFHFYEGTLGSVLYSWAEPKAGIELTPDQLIKTGQQLNNYINHPIIFLFKRLESWQRKRIIEKRVAFVQPGKQLYIPEQLLQLNDLKKTGSNDQVAAEQLSYPGQLGILYHLEVDSLENRPLQAIADVLHYSKMTVTRIAKELSNLELISSNKGKERSFRFSVYGRALWEKALAFMQSPVRETWFTDRRLDFNHFKLSGESALAEYSMINDPAKACFAIGKDEFRQLQKGNNKLQLHKQYGDYKIEVWHYDPFLLSKTRSIDKLSLYLSMKDEDDERLQGQLEDMINNVPW